MTHVIRLRGSWATAESLAGVRHSRNFGRPGRLGADERVWLVCSLVPGAAKVSLNGRPVGSLSTSGPFEVDVTHELANRNTVEFDIASREPLGDVAIEIRG